MFQLQCLVFGFGIWFASSCACVLWAQEQDVDPFGSRIQVAEFFGDRVKVSDPILKKDEAGFRVEFALENVSSEAVLLVARSRFEHQDGEGIAIIPVPNRGEEGAIEGLARGFVGMVMLGFSEVTEQQDVNDFIQSTHRVAAGERFEVVHRLATSAFETVRVVCEVDVPARVRANEERETQRARKDLYWDRRDAFFRERQKEQIRWKEARTEILEERADLEPGSEAYQEAMERYWESHEEHRDRLAGIEEDFFAWVRANPDSER